MNSLLVKTPGFVQRLYPKRLWAFPNEVNSVFLTFDDGPIPEVTPWVLETLAAYDAKATFFCIGRNVEKHPEIFDKIISEGHAIGNHSYSHLKGWQTSTSEYINDFEIAEDIIQNQESFSEDMVKLFRPPYGKLTSTQAASILKKDYKIVMWDVLSYDYDQKISEEKCLDNVKGNLESGSIVVFHDSLKAEKSLRFALPILLDSIRNKGWMAKSIDNSLFPRDR
ncbi:MAG: polysaccharide deacetylase family protein [Bacteroidia bacterium]|nr:polysaccharide deacetylase family protein [Bacteroidia bacterium]NNF30807.1 polysaccharide deacetylase family protein [Flavobacteriaceae bacterium]MBT8277148.1 polysaccharide deacetylase family protein [Bacteroidia bacterium]NNJ80857.1 polysaccharide deacetylase family protein [Flavobacteriaceae bacterium]NNK55615.1 polysaccharide deacetylase family protein [Flavobacteriaceae bacterium]